MICVSFVYVNLTFTIICCLLTPIPYLERDRRKEAGSDEGFYNIDRKLHVVLKCFIRFKNALKIIFSDGVAL